MKIRTIQRGLILFWAVYFFMVWTTNVFDALKARGLFGPNLAYGSKNYEAIVKVTSGVGPAWLPPLLFAGVLAWEGLAAVLFCWSWWVFRGVHQPGVRIMNTAFAVGLALWAAFNLADEIFIAYELEGTHRSLFAFQLLCLLALYLLPDDAGG